MRINFKFKTLCQYIGYLVICVIVFAVIFDSVNRAVFYFRYTGPKASRDARQDLSVFKNADWAQEYFQEFKAAGYTYESYLGWKGKAFKGKFINVSSEGVRKTWNPAGLDKSKAKLVYCFGGSALWGVGARDDYTVPSFISKFLNKDGEQYYVINYGQQGYNSSQEVIYLMLLIKDKQIPDYVLFFDGINDLHCAYTNNKTGDAADFTEKREKLKYEGEIKSNRDYLKKFIRGYIDARINAYAFTRKMRQKYRKWKETDDEGKLKIMTIEDRDEGQLLSLANDAVDNYFNLTEIVRGLSDLYGFKVAFFWQPMTGAHISSSEEEAEFTSKMGEKKFEFNQLAYKIVEGKKNQKDFFDLQKIFESKDKNTTVFIDFCHLSELGNSLVAQRMVDVFKSKMIR